MSSFSRIVAGGLIGLGVAAGGLLAGQSLVESRLGFRTVTVKGLSEREVKANLGFWPLRFVATGPTLEEARAKLEVFAKRGRGLPQGQGLHRAGLAGAEHPGGRQACGLQCARRRSRLSASC